MSSNSKDLVGPAIFVSDECHLFAKPYPSSFGELEIAASAKHVFQISTGEFSLLKIGRSALGASGVISLLDYIRVEKLSKAERDAFLFEIFASENGKLLVDGDERAIDSLFDIMVALKPDAGSAIVHRVRGLEEAVLVYPRTIDLNGDVSIFGKSSAQFSSAAVIQSGRFLVHKRPQLRVAALEPSHVFDGSSVVIVTSGGVFFLALNYLDYVSIDDLYRRNAREDHDILQMFLQCSRSARHIISKLLTQDLPRSLLADESWGLYFELEAVHQLSNGYFISGWFTDPEDRILDVVILDYRLDEPDIVEHWSVSDEVRERDGKRALAKRFRAFTPGKLRGDPFPPRVRVALRGGMSLLLMAPSVVHDALKQRDAILATIEDRTFSEDLFETVYVPALAPLQQKLNERQSIRTSLSFGSRSRREVTLVIPLYAQLGFVRSQLMAFSQDQFLLDACQIIYALDDPRLAREAQALLEGYDAWAKLDIQLLILDRNGGYAVANNTAASEAEGEHLVLLNSDVIPTEPGWIESSLRALHDAPQFSVVGPKLLYADDSLQHAGMYFQKFPHGYWQNLHYWKGFGREYIRARETRIVPAVTGACMILQRSDFLEVGGFTADYVLGDYEDSDLCLKLRGRGGQCVYLASAELYHFERQSMPKIEDGHDRRSTIYNRALHTGRWNEKIADLMAEFG